MTEHPGAFVPRREDPRLLTGRGRFVDDHAPPGCLHVAFLRSPHAHARVRAIDTSAAARAPGAITVVTAHDLGKAGGPIPPYAEHPGLPRPCRIAPLAADRVRFVGEAVAAVVAENPYAARDALDLVAVEWEPLPAVTDVVAAARPDAPPVHDWLGTNVAGEWAQRVGDPDDAFRRAEVTTRITLRISRGGAHPLEPRALVASWDGQRLSVRATVQLVHRYRRALAVQLGLSEAQVHVVAPPDVGGGFGTKAMLYPEDFVVAVLAVRLGRPVKWVETRHEHALAAAVEREQVHEVEIAAARDGRILALRDRFLHELGAYTVSGLNLPQNTLIHSVGPYRIPSLDLSVRAVLTHTTPVGAYRGAGRPQGTWVIERAVDALARHLGLDPLEVRRRNLLAAADHPHDTGLRTAGRGPVVYDSGDVGACLDAVLARLDLPAFRREQARLRAEGRYLGVGIVAYVEATASAPLEAGSVRIESDGRAVVATGAAPQGQGHETMLSRLIGRALGLDPDRVDVVTGDTDAIPQGGGTFGSRTAALGGSAAWLAAGVVVDRGRRIAARLLEAAYEDVVCENGAFRVRGFPDRAVTWADVAAHARSDGPDGDEELRATEVFTVAQSTFAGGSHAAVVEVDAETGAVRILRWIVAHDCGRVLEPVIVDGQVHGGVVQGLADALNEQLAHDGTGQRLTSTLMEYALATAADAPSFEVAHLETPTPLNPLGVKGAGEGGIMPVAPVIAQAIEDALAPFGARVTRIPVTRAAIAAMARAR